MSQASDSTQSSTNPVLLWLIGVVLLLPFIGIAYQNRLQPALETFNYSFQKVDMIQDRNEFVGNANYERIAQDRTFASATSYTVQTVFVRMSLALVVALVVGGLAGQSNFIGRSITRLVLSGALLLALPIVLGILWIIWTSSMIANPDPNPAFALNNPTTAPYSLLVADSLITLALALGAGATAVMAVLRGRGQGYSVGKALFVVALLIAFVALGTAPITFTLPYIVTSGGPVNSTSTVGFEMFNVNFRMPRLGYGAVYGVLLIMGGGLITLLIGLLQVGVNLRLVYVRETTPRSSILWGIMGAVLALGAILPIGALLLWTNNLEALSNTAGQVSEQANPGLISPYIPTLITIWALQLPITFLAGFALGFLRPFGRIVANLLFIALLVIAFIPSEALYGVWFVQLRQAGLVNTLDALAIPWRVNGFALLIFKMIFDGLYERYREGSLSLLQALISALPMAVVMGVVQSFFAMQDFSWALVAILEPNLYPYTLHLAFLRGKFATEIPSIGILAIQYLTQTISLFIIPMLAIQIGVLDRLAIVAGERNKTKRDEAVV